jgi:hypothetical protein
VEGYRPKEHVRIVLVYVVDLEEVTGPQLGVFLKYVSQIGLEK